MAVTVESFFEKLWSGKIDSCSSVFGENPFLERELRTGLIKAGYEVFRQDIKISSPAADLLDQALTTSLFQPQRALWVQSKNDPEKWTKEGLRIWDRIVENSDVGSMVVFLQVNASPKAGKKTKGKVAALSLEGPNFGNPIPLFWLDIMNSRRKNFLDKTRINFLLSLELDLMALENAVELWSLGGDLWAKESLGWGLRDSKSGADSTAGNPAFAWVDAVLDGREPEAALLGRRLMQNGGEFLMILGLLTKSLKIWAALESGRSGSEYPPFLVSKLQKVRKVWAQRERASAPALQRVLRWTANSDLWIKSRPVGDENLLLRISESARN